MVQSYEIFTRMQVTTQSHAIGFIEFNIWSDSIFETYNMCQQNENESSVHLYLCSVPRQTQSFTYSADYCSITLQNSSAEWK